ncbi:hypothetical protein EIP86_007987 [Pleurotus ostreatoroseus]|nr:hypothetical protein EIP86_007987 [Pleurotus ostreatoroseus]
MAENDFYLQDLQDTHEVSNQDLSALRTLLNLRDDEIVKYSPAHIPANAEWVRWDDHSYGLEYNGMAVLTVICGLYRAWRSTAPLRDKQVKFCLEPLRNEDTDHLATTFRTFRTQPVHGVEYILKERTCRIYPYMSTTYDGAYPVFDRTHIGEGKAEDAVHYEDLQDDDVLAVEAALILYRRDDGVKPGLWTQRVFRLLQKCD